MIKIVFLLGCPGSGKSSVAQLISMFARDTGWITDHIFDYKFLQELFLQEVTTSTSPHKRKFKPRGPEECHGFDVVQFSVLDEVLKVIADQVEKEWKEQAFSNENKFILIEFARNDYLHALQRFSDALLEGAYFLYIYADEKTCLERVRQRVDCESEYGHFVSEEIMRGYYRKDDWYSHQLAEYLKNTQGKFDMSLRAVEIDNGGSKSALQGRVQDVVFSHLITELVPA
jgi:adenylate kinase family enzyme